MTAYKNIRNDNALNKAIEEKRDAEQLLRYIAPKYMGVYVLDRETDCFHDILGPDYFRSLVSEKDGKFSDALRLYGEKFVVPEDKHIFTEAMDYDSLYEDLERGKNRKFSYRKTDGTIVSLEILRYSSCEEESNLSFWVYTDEGITYKKQLGVEDSASNMVHATMTSGLWFIDYDDKGKLFQCTWSNAFRKILGYDSLEDFPDTWDAWMDKLHPDDKVRVDRSYENAVMDYSGQTTYDVEYRMRNKNGEYHWIRDTAHISRQTDGTPICANGLVMLVDDKHQMETMLREALEKEKRNRELLEKHQLQKEEQLAIFNALSSGYTNVFMIDLENDTAQILKLNGYVTTGINKYSRKNFSYEKTAMQYVTERVHPDEHERMYDALSTKSIMEKLKDNNEYTGNYRVIQTGEVHYYQFKYIKLEKFNYVIAAYQNVDEIVATEQEQQRQLKLALDAAEQSSRAKTTFLSSMSHDIRTPMNAIVGFTALAQTHIDNKEMVKDYLSKINTSSTHLLSLINDILDMSRIESGSVKLDENIVHMPTLLHDLRNMIQGMVNSKQQNLYIDTQDIKNEDIITDKLRLNQVLLNIVSNAIKFTPTGGDIIIRLIEKPCSRQGYSTFEFFIKDNGIGMSQKFVEHVFDTFAREHTATVSGIQGTGLGMAITKNIVDMMGGTIKVDSQLGKGSAFTVTLDVKVSSQTITYEPIPELQGARALVIDDDINTCRSVCKMLRDIDMRPDWTTSGKEAILRTQDAMEINDSYRVYIVDYLIPDMNGVETVRRIRKVIGDDVPIIVLTAYDWADFEAEAREAGVTAFVAKPIFMSELRAVLTKKEVRALEPGSVIEDDHFDFSGKCALLVEDNELNREIAMALLGSTGIEIDVAEDGIEAVSIINESPEDKYDVILMDIQMPRMDGYTATREIRTLQNNRKANIPIIAMTANAFEEDRRKAFETGMNGHIVKPLEMKVIGRTLEKVFAGQPLV